MKDRYPMNSDEESRGLWDNHTDASKSKTELWSGQIRELVMEVMMACQYRREEYRPNRVR